MTNTEKKLWNKFLRIQDYNVARQKIIDNYIVDFYIASSKLVIEIDGETHWSEKEIVYDKKRTELLQSYGLRVIRFTNTEIYNDFEEVCKIIMDLVRNPPTPFNKGGEKKNQKPSLLRVEKSMDLILCSSPFVGVRIPDSGIILEILEGLDYPIVATSANISGEKEAVSAHDVYKIFGNQIPLILDGGKCKDKLGSTVLRVEEDDVKIFREGPVSRGEILKL